MTTLDPNIDSKIGNDAQILWRIVMLCMRYPGRVIIAVGATIIASLFQLAVPQLIGSAVDGALGLLEENNTVGYSANMALFQTAALLLGVSILRGLFTLIHNYTGEAVGHMMAYDLRLSFYNKLQC